ncbi:MAG: hypothetical protein HYR55_03135, partial [Acidobacteria bacterium]|nr:hypothetical protein [Acidobacteriota bacterium]
MEDPDLDDNQTSKTHARRGRPAKPAGESPHGRVAAARRPPRAPGSGTAPAAVDHEREGG